MKKRFNIVFSDFYLKDKEIPHLKNHLLDVLKRTPYLEETGFGYKNIEEEDRVIYITLIKRTITSVLEYIVEENEFRSIDIPIFEEIKFSVDIERSLLYSFGAVSNLNKIKTALRNTFDVPFTYKSMPLSPVEILDKLLEHDKDFSFLITELIITNFKYKEGIHGKYVAKINKQNLVSEILKDYSKEIQKVSISILGDTEYDLTISSNQSLSIKCEEDDLFTILENLKHRIYG